MNAPLRARDREPMPESTKTVLWVLGGLAAVGAGVAIGAMWAKPKPSGSPFLQPITDANTVRYYQGGFASALAQLPAGGDPDLPGLDGTMYLAGEVDGNPKNARWLAVLAQFQRDVNASFAKNGPPTTVPAGYPSQLRTDGVLDYATAIALANA